MQSNMAGRMSILLILLSFVFSSCSRMEETLQEEIDRGHALFEEGDTAKPWRHTPRQRLWH